MTTHEAAAGATYGRLLQIPAVRALFGCSLATVLASSLQIFALSVVVYHQTGSALWSSSAFAAGFLPQLVGGSLLTSLADRWPARPVLLTAAAVRAGTAAVLAVGHLPPALSIALVAVMAIWQPLPSAVQSALVSRLLTGELYVLGRSVFNIISYGAQLLGLALGGAVIAALGPAATFALAAGIQLCGLLAAARIPRGPTAAPVRSARWSLTETWRGNVGLLQTPSVRAILLSWWLPTTMLVGAESLVVAYVAGRGGSAAPTGLLLAAFPAGAALGDVVVGRWLRPGQRRRAVPWLFCLLGAALLPLAWYPPTAVAAGCFVLASAASSYQLGGQQAFVDSISDDRRGLAFGLFGTGLQTGQGIGPVLAGALADLVGAGATITALGASVLLLALRFARLPQVVGEPAQVGTSS